MSSSFSYRGDKIEAEVESRGPQAMVCFGTG